MAHELLIYGLAFGSMGCAAVAAYPAVSQLWGRFAGPLRRYQRGKILQAARDLEDIFVEVRPARLKLAYGIGPFILGLVLWLFFDNLFVAAGGVVAGIVVPDLWVKQRKAIRKRRFQAQLVDALFLLSSSMRAGLSLFQALETIEAEMEPPVSQEIGLVLKAHSVGMSLEDALEGLNRRMPCEEVTLATTALLLARGTGGDVTRLVDQLAATIREKKKLRDKVSTLTLQGRLQAYIMSLLPLFFGFFVRTFNPNYFDVFMQDRTGQLLLGLVILLWGVGMTLMVRLSRVPV